MGYIVVVYARIGGFNIEATSSIVYEFKTNAERDLTKILEILIGSGAIIEGFEIKEA